MSRTEKPGSRLPEENNGRGPRPNAATLFPMAVFLAIYLGNGIWFEYIRPVEGGMGFYITSVPVAFGIALAAAFLQNRKMTFDEKIRICARGLGDDNIAVMLMIFLLAGAFSGIAGAAGGALSTANMLLNVVPPGFAVPGLFVISCLISVAMGTSVGTITVLAPIAVAASESGGLPLPLCVASVVGGSMFGDNLSVISDTTIAATKTQEIGMKDKFLANIRIALPAALATLALLIILSVGNGPASVGRHDFRFILTLPYFAVLVMAVSGMNVFTVLLIGILLFLAAGFGLGTLDFAQAFAAMRDGTSGMFETMVVTVLVAFISALIRAGGGFEAILAFIRGRVRGKRGGMLGIALLAAFMDAATANNTLAIIVAAPIARDISDEFGVPRKTSASLLDTCSCIMQGIIPYGAQLLVAANLTGLASLSIIPLMFYPFILAVCVAVSIVRPGPEKAREQKK
ncbi:MAG: Na+/H+ antiporter NhaC family protein [Clostridia bacterium]|nr:Na+/H+ antiporter NhaC family protein [Clostridia bacterium]